ncbi:hypothetical protein FKG94_21160 [Exilibacterium tricleocarpae]|uniref:Aminoglycoside phosphotransferase domain-containing protein n=1 Tax=Exilibacterium tricleocarpae TaxID=2591008 RepID=A0A545SZY5_9GAMM|nr:phosphotransferase [Exilibacterium tricleocarpae]TQV70534.1 hypothetical protein FKG94_21160 [Exilibacterium tricleocarpae]
MPHLCRHTASLLARDRAIAGLPLLFDTDALVAHLNSAGGSPPITAADLTYLRYKPGTNCLAKYRLHTASGPVDVYAKAYSDEDAAEKLAKDRQRPAVAGPLGCGRWFFAARNLVISAFPNDAKLRYLARLGDPTRVRQHLTRILGAAEVRPDVALQPLAYKPERRYVVRASWTDDTGATLEHVIKYVTAQEFARVQPLLQCLEVQPIPGIPQLAGMSGRYRALAFAWQPGTGLREITAAANIDYRYLEATGRALALFHRQAAAIKTLPCRDFAARLQALNEQMAFLLPSLETRMDTLVRELIAWWKDQNETCGVVHGDFYDKQVVVTGEHVSILDIDSVESGHPTRDLGLFIAHLERDAISGNVAAAEVTRLGDALLRGYLRAGGEIAIDQLRAYTAFGLAQLAHHPFRSNETHWAEKTERLLIRATALFDSARVTAIPLGGKAS